eukprot:2242861-Karenia_brevis.AAC.1
MHVEAIKEAQTLRVDNELLSSRCKRLELQEEKAVFEAHTLGTMQALMEEKVAFHVSRDELRESQLTAE